LTSSRRRPDRPIESVVLRISFRGDRETLSEFRKALPSSKLKEGVLELKIEGTEPQEVEQKAREVLEKLREVEGGR
jgi:hypothetical protein